MDAAGRAAPGVGGEVLSFYFFEFRAGDRVYRVGGGVDRTVVPIALIIIV